MGVRVQCPACRAALSVNNPNYLVVVRCHDCGCEFLTQQGLGEPEPAEPPVGDPWMRETLTRHSPSRPEDPGVLTFCPMCGELTWERASNCPACGEPFPEVTPPGQPDPESLSRRFRRLAQLLGVLWMLLAGLLIEQDIWVGGSGFGRPEILAGANIMIPPVPLLSTGLVCLAVFALIGKFWAVAVGGLYNYLVLFLMVSQAHLISLVVLGAIIVLTHITLHQVSSTRFW